MDELDNMLNEAAKSVTEATDHVSNIVSHSSQLKLQISKTKEMYPSETSVALKETAENLLNLISSHTKNSANRDVASTNFLDFKSIAEERIASIDGILNSIGCILNNK
ncbi:hypothetical protein Bhyg_02680 [Pseudolycoriella hygida]|uniref:Uncharacterized protein n=1 Tax=Pseudolycoriella hygida TaxID=35572 RepID=A0A9Q0NCN4_9DIPT|nr:hypothetical protein Bhyg_02680 [Pseudolycoriella hygida]